MPNLSEISQWETGIYKIEEDDVVQGGDDGISNRAAAQLANRTLFLKNQQTAHQEADDPHTQYLRDDQKATQAQAIAGLDNESWMTALRVAQAINALATTIANASETVAGKVELATPAETITGADTTRATHSAGVHAAIQDAIANLDLESLLDVPQIAPLGAHVLALADRGSSVDTAAPVTIPTSATIEFPIGSTVSLTNISNAGITVTPAAGVTLRRAGTNQTGARTLAAYGMATLRKVAADEWYIVGAGVQ